MVWTTSKIALAAILACASIGFAQQSGKEPASPKKESSGSTTGTGDGSSSTSSGPSTKKLEPGSLEEMLDKALRNNADIKAAEAKVRDAEAEANRVRHQVVAKIVTLRNDVDLSKKMLAHAQLMAELATANFRTGKVTQQDLAIANSNVEKQKAELAKLEADLKAVLGSYTRYRTYIADGQYLAESFDAIRVWDATTGARIESYPGTLGLNWGISATTLTVQTSMADRIKSALDKRVKLSQGAENVPLKDVLQHITEIGGIDVPFRVLGKFEDDKVSLMKTELPLGAWLQAMEDSVPNLRFVVREYGILATPKDRIPDGAISVQEFWKRTENAKTQTKTPDGKR